MEKDIFKSDKVGGNVRCPKCRSKDVSGKDLSNEAINYVEYECLSCGHSGNSEE